MSDQSTIEGNEPASPAIFKGVSAQWLCLAEAAAHLGVNAESLRLFVRGVDGRPVLVSREIRGRLCVRPGEAYAHLLKHSPRCRGLTPPPGYTSDAMPAAVQSIAIAAPAAPDDMADLLRQLTVNVNHLAGADVNPDTLRAISQAVKTLEDIQTRRDKMLRKVDPDDVAAMLRALGETYAEHISEIGAARAAARLVRYIRAVFDLDLAAQNIEASRLLEAQLREDAQDTITAVQKCVDEKCAGVTLLPLEGEK